MVEERFKSFGSFLSSAYHAAAGHREDTRLVRATSYSSDVDSVGGFLVPEEFKPVLLQVALEAGLARPRATVYPMTRDRQLFPNPVVTDHSGNTYYGGVSVAFYGQGGTRSASTGKLGRIALEAGTLEGMTYTSKELIDDAGISVEEMLRQLFGSAIRFVMDDRFINGVGTNGEPLGILKSGALIEVAKESGQSSDTIVYANVNNMLSRLLPESYMFAIWMGHPETITQLTQLETATGSSVFVANTSRGEGGCPFYLFGIPFYPTEKCQKLGDLGDLILADWRYYVIGERTEIVVVPSLDEPTSFVQGEVCWRIFVRFAGQPALSAPITPLHANTGKTLSPFITLAERAA